jgi:hypothetical protein
MTKKKVTPTPIEPVKEMLFLRTCKPGGISHSGFVWPLTVGATVTAPDWDPSPKCGNGLHGLKDGQGDARLMGWSEDAIWIVFSAPSGVDLIGKWKVQTATIRVVGDRRTATDYLVANKLSGVHGSTATAGDSGTATAGYSGTATAGEWGTATAGYSGTATAGYRGTATAGEWGSIAIYWWDGIRMHVKVGAIGENGLKPNTKYSLNDAHEFEEAAE